MSKQVLVLVAVGAFFLGACASSKPKTAADGSASNAIASTQAAIAKPVAPPILVGPDIIAAVPIDMAWKTVSDVENWGTWNPKVTKVVAGAGLNTGAEIRWDWEERGIRSTVADVKDGELLLLKGCKTGDEVQLRWIFKALDPTHTVISLRAILKAGVGQTPIANAGVETQAWLTALQDELDKQASELAAAKKAKKTKK